MEGSNCGCPQRFVSLAPDGGVHHTGALKVTRQSAPVVSDNFSDLMPVTEPRHRRAGPDMIGLRIQDWGPFVVDPRACLRATPSALPDEARSRGVKSSAPAPCSPASQHLHAVRVSWLSRSVRRPDGHSRTVNPYQTDAQTSPGRPGMTMCTWPSRETSKSDGCLPGSRLSFEEAQDQDEQNAFQGNGSKSNCLAMVAHASGQRAPKETPMVLRSVLWGVVLALQGGAEPLLVLGGGKGCVSWSAGPENVEPTEGGKIGKRGIDAVERLCQMPCSAGLSIKPVASFQRWEDGGVKSEWLAPAGAARNPQGQTLVLRAAHEWQIADMRVPHSRECSSPWSSHRACVGLPPHRRAGHRQALCRIQRRWCVGDKRW
ncbi:hypothetical protein ACCO45_010462 [Purpureocillium lilacinum]|uniref:Uncharacterized protein n=1 Tax=Purpureocillium lilacinum TaxID=33203 RepID=A0ACC4DH53_PURLI